MLSGEGVVDEKILFVVVHGITEVNRLHAPAVLLELLNNVIMEVLVVDGHYEGHRGTMLNGLNDKA